MQVMLLSCSPRKCGNCDIVSSWAHEFGADVVALRDYDVQPCVGCEACEVNGVCRIQDSVPNLYSRLEASDAVVVVAPVYFRSFDAHTKAFFDRAQVYFHLTNRVKKPFFLVSIGGQIDAKNADGQIATLESFGFTFGAKLCGVLRLQADAKGSVDTDEARQNFDSTYKKWLQSAQKG